MAESTLSIGFVDLKQEVGFFLGYGRTEASWSTSQAAEVDAVVQSGVRRVYYPLVTGDANIDNVIIGYEWSFLRPTTTLVTAADDSDYDLPDNYGAPYGDFHYAANLYTPPVTMVSLGAILDSRSHNDTTGKPAFYAVRYKACDGSAGQRVEVLFYPKPDAVYTLSYEYDAYSGKLTDEKPYPLGGMKLAELYIESCLAVAEQRLNDEAGLHTQAYQLLLLDAIVRDKKKEQKNYGHMGHVEEASGVFRRGETGANYPITYKGETL